MPLEGHESPNELGCRDEAQIHFSRPHHGEQLFRKEFQGLTERTCFELFISYTYRTFSFVGR
jgi:hypothetical protein